MSADPRHPAQHFEAGIMCLLILARYFGLPADGAQLRHEFGQGGKSLDLNDLVRAAKRIGFKAGVSRASWSELGKIPLPAVVPFKDGHFVVLAKVEEEKALLQDPAEGRPVTVSREEFASRWTGQLLLLTTRSGTGAKDRPFDFTWFIPAIVKHRHLLGQVMVASFFIQVFALLTPLFTQVVIDKVLVHKGLTTLHVMAIGMIALILFDVVLGGLRGYVFSHTSSRIDVGLGAQLFRHLLALPMAYFEARRVGDTVARVRELETIRQFLTGSTVTLVIDLFFSVVFLAVMILYSPLLTLVVVGAMPFYIGLSLFVTPIIRGRLHEKFNRGAENQAFLVETVSGIETVKSLAVEPGLQRRWEEQLAGYVKASFRTTTLMTVAGQAASFIQKATILGILWLGAHQVMRGELTVGQLIAFNMLAGLMSAPILRIVHLWHEFQQAGISVQRLGDLLNAPTERASTSRATLPPIKGAIRFEDVSFRYGTDGPEVLRDISFSVEPGQLIGIVGRSGSGKSTVAKLIQRLHVPERGRILVDGVDLALVDPVWLRRQVGVVLQENFLFNRSVRENIALADPGVSMDRVVRAAELAGAHDFILELPEGYDTMVGEHGCSLSGGQRQRIAIARALLTDPSILIFDEATSALDYESERIIQQNLGSIRKNRTMILISHRLAMLRPAHNIIVLERGGLVEQGTHEDLLKRNGLYAKLYRHQEGTYAVA